MGGDWEIHQPNDLESPEALEKLSRKDIKGGKRSPSVYNKHISIDYDFSIEDREKDV